MTIRAIVFDIGGVLEITPETGWQEKWEKRLSFQSGGLKGLLSGDVWKNGALQEYPEEELYKSLIRIPGMDQEQAEAFLHDFWAWYLGELNVELATYFGNLRPRYQTAMLSNSFTGARQREEDRYRFSELTDFIIYSHEVGLAKPDRRIYELTCERLGVQPEEVIFLDDHESCLAGARELGMHAILFQDTTQAIADIQAVLDAHSS